MKIALFFLISILFVSGCKASKNLGEQAESIDGLEQPKERNYTESELTIGRRICSALKNKRELFETVTNMQERFRFKGETKACDNPNPYNISEFTVAVSNVSSTNFEYVAITSRANYFKDVITDQEGVMKIICDNLSNSEAVSNTILSGSSYLSVNLLIDDGYDRFDILKRSKDSASSYKLVSSESVWLFTQSSQVDKKFFGVEKIRVRNSTCPNSKDFSSLKQTWVSALTSF